MATKKAVTKKSVTKAPAAKAATPVVKKTPLELQITKTATPKRFVNKDPLKIGGLQQRITDLGIKPPVAADRILASVNKINPEAFMPVAKMPEDLQRSLPELKPAAKRFHGLKASLLWFPFPMVFSKCSDKFGYMSSAAVRAASKLPFNIANQALMASLGDMMGDAGRDTAPDSTIPAGFTYFGQFVDHDVTFDVSSSLDADTDANTINNMRTPALDLDSLYGRGPALDPFLYAFPSSGPASAIKFQLGTNTNTGPGGPGGTAGFGGMQVQTDFDVPRINNPLNPNASTHTAVIGDPRNDENLIVVQFHQTMLRFHNQVVDLLVLASFSGDIFVEAKKIVTHHY